VEKSKVKSATDSIQALVALVESLRGAHGCPWDKKQTPRTMIVYLLEEMYELADAIESSSAGEVREELGDVLFHIVFITRLFQEAGHFTVDDVAREITEKMIRRHPHVFGDTRVNSSDEVKQNWHKIKQDEKKRIPQESVIDSVPKKLPALMRAYQVSERTARSGFDWGDIESLLGKSESEIDALKRALKHTDKDRIYKDFGALLFSLVHLARCLKIHPETALSGALKAFERRFKQMEKRVSASGKDLHALSRLEIGQLWKETE
jgi:tetrapyrrole methylase family protein/MazG family protein